MKSGVLIAVGAAVLAALYFVTRKKAPVLNYGIGAVGTQSHSPVSSAGVALASLLGQNVSSWFGGGATSVKQIAADPNTPMLGNGVITNPVYPSPSVLPYSYKQQVIDTPALLGTDALFTPNATGSGSSGGYSDQGGPQSTNLNQAPDILNYGFGP